MGRVAASASGVLVALGVELGDLEREAECAHDVARRGRHARRADDRCDRRHDPAQIVDVEVEVPRRPRFMRYDAGGASTATSAAIRTSISFSASRLDASSESNVMLCSRSRTGVSVVSAMRVLLPGGYAAISGAAWERPFHRQPPRSIILAG